LNNRDKKRLVADGVDIYSHTFSTNKLRDAHQFCWDTFKEAIKNLMRGKIHEVKLDNTNSQKWEYEKYLQYIIDQGLAFTIFEVACSNPSQVSIYCR